MTAIRRVVFNQKGGVGKSTLTANLAAIAARHGQRVLVIDLDPQGNLSHYLLGDALPDTQAEHSLLHWFDQTLSFSLFPRPTDSFLHATPFPQLTLMASHPGLGELAPKLEARYKMFKLRDLLAELSDRFDEIWIDTPPALNFFSRSALIACDRCLIPFDCDSFARQALYQLMDNVAEIRADHNPDLRVEGIVVNQFQPRSSLPVRQVAELEAEGLPICRQRISSSVRIRESHEACKPLIHLDARHKLTGEFAALYQELSGCTVQQSS